MPDNLHDAIAGEEFDHLALLFALRRYARPRDRITRLLQRGEIIRVKKGIYVFGEQFAGRPFCREILANMLYGPSYISHEWALHHHGLVAERPAALTSVVCGQPRRFSTPVGDFIYRPLPLWAYRIGIDLATPPDGAPPFLVATPEKAVADRIHDERKEPLLARRQMKAFLLERLRIAPEALTALDPRKFSDIAASYGSRKLWMLAFLIRRITSGKERLP